MDNSTREILQHRSARYIADLFLNHDISCRVDGNKIFFDKELISIETYYFDRNSSPEFKVLQLDVYVDYGADSILESFAGLGNDFETAASDGFENFKNNSFHTILSAFFTSKYDREINKYNWTINGKDFEVFLGNIGIRGNKPSQLTSKWLDQFEAAIQQLQLGEGTHWIRLFFAQQENKTNVCEVLLNNEYCIPLQQKAESFDWYRQEAFYSIRVFMILKNGVDFGRVVKIIAGEEEYDEAFLRLTEMGLPELEIEKAYAFIPEALGRKLNKEMGVAGTYSNQAVVMNNNKEQFDINLDNEKIYRDAVHLINKLTKKGWDKDLKELATTSAAFNTLNTALNQGAKLEDFDCGGFSAIFYIPTYAAATPTYATTSTTQKKKRIKRKIWGIKIFKHKCLPA